MKNYFLCVVGGLDQALQKELGFAIARRQPEGFVFEVSWQAENELEYVWLGTGMYIDLVYIRELPPDVTRGY